MVHCGVKRKEIVPQCNGNFEIESEENLALSLAWTEISLQYDYWEGTQTEAPWSCL